jgi:Protein of unknown function (DUF3551)
MMGRDPAALQAARRVPQQEMCNEVVVKKFGIGPVVIGTVMTTIMSVIATVSIAATPHPWCLIVQDQDGVWACAFDTFEQCSVEARAGNTGFCAANPAYQAPASAPSGSTKRRRPR